MAQPAPTPNDWKVQTFITMQAADKDVLAALKKAQADINKMLKELVGRPSIGAQIRREQLLLAKRNIQREMAELWRKVGDITAARRLEAAARLLDVNKSLDTFKMLAAGVPGGPEVAANIAAAELEAARTGMDRMIARVSGASYTPLATRVYLSTVRINGQVDRAVNSALARGLSAREFARSIQPFISPATSGGVRYAAMRLARTEINNAAHAVAVDAQRDKPWTTGMQWNLSGSHPRPDVCDALAHGGENGDGVYPVAKTPSKPHPQCFCFVTPETVDDDTFLDNLVGGKYNDYLKRYANPSTFGTPAPAPKPKKVAPTPTKAAKKASPAPKKAPTALPPAQSPASAAATRTQSATPTPTTADLGKQHALKLVNESGVPSAFQGRVTGMFNRLADQAPGSMVRLRDFKILDAAGTKQLKIDTQSPNAIGGYTRGLRTIRFADSVISPAAEISARRAWDTRWWSNAAPGTKQLDHVLAHEFGHHLDEMVRRLPFGSQVQFWNEVLDALNLSTVRVGQLSFNSVQLWNEVLIDVIKPALRKYHFGVSEYGTKSAAELLAEIFAEHMNGGALLRPNIEAAAQVLLRYAEMGAAI